MSIALRAELPRELEIDGVVHIMHYPRQHCLSMLLRVKHIVVIM